MKKRNLFIIGATMLVAFSGCRNASVNAAENYNKTARMNVIATKHVQTDPNLTETVNIVRLNTATTAAGLLRAQAAFENFTDERVTISYMIEWYDADAMLVLSAGGGWQQEVFEPRETRQLTFTAPNPSAKDFCIKLLKVGK